METTIDDIASMTGQKQSDRPSYKLNEIKLSGDDGTFSLREVLSEKNAEGKFQVAPLGPTFKGVILKMRWRLNRFVEAPGKSMMSTEYDDKAKDQIIEFSTGDKGSVTQLKGRHNLQTQRILYVYLPIRKEIVRVIVKSSALSANDPTSRANPDGSVFLFDYIDNFNKESKYVHEHMTVFGSVHRKDKGGNKRKDYYAMTFKRGEELGDPERNAKVLGFVKEVHDKTTAMKMANAAEVQNANEPTNEIMESMGIEYPTEEINPDDIPF